MWPGYREGRRRCSARRVSAKNNDFDELRTTLEFVAEVSDLRADPSRARQGRRPRRFFRCEKSGLTVDGVMRWGTLRKGDVIVCGDWHGKKLERGGGPLGCTTEGGGPRSTGAV